MCRNKTLNMKQHNAKEGCTFCHHKTEWVDNYSKFTFSPHVVPALRTDSEIKNAMVKVAFTSESKPDTADGIKGPSVLMNLKHFDLVKNMTNDPMHSFLLGVIRDYTELLLTESDKDYYIGSPANIEIIDKRLKSIRVPKCITRTPRSIETRANWKASEWRSWLIFYMLPCLKGLLKKKYYDHISLLVKAVRIYLDKSLDPSQNETARLLLIKFNVRMQQYFGKGYMKFVYHLSLHTPDSVESWGPLWLNNCFSFEDENRKILDSKKSPTFVAIQLAKKYLFKSAVNSFEAKFNISQNVKSLCEQIFSNRAKIFHKVGNVNLIGSGIVYDLKESELNKLPRFQEKILNSKIFSKIIVNNRRYTSINYKREKKTDNSFFKHKNNDFGRINKILYLLHSDSSETILIIYEHYEVKDKLLLTSEDVNIDYIKECFTHTERPRKLRFCVPNDLDGPCMCMNIDGKCFITAIPYGCMGD